MVSRFRRSFSSPTANSRRMSAAEKPCHVRSISLPTRSHPLISHLNDEIRDLRSWTARSGAGDLTSRWICDGLIRLKNLHDSVSDLLHLSQTGDSLRRRTDLVERLLEEFLCFIDVYGCFREAMVGFREELSAAQMAARRRDESIAKSVDLYVKAWKKMEKEMVKLSSTLRSVGRWSAKVIFLVPDDEAELVGVLRDVSQVTVVVTMCWVNAMSASCKIINNGKKGSWNLLSCKKKKSEREVGLMREFEEVEAEIMKVRELRKWREEEVRRLLGRMEELENCVVAMEDEISRVFKSLISTRVSLLNIRTQNSC